MGDAAKPPAMLPKPPRNGQGVVESPKFKGNPRQRVHHASPLEASSPAVHKETTIAVVGDVHGQWNDASAAALASLNADLVCFVGDLGNEDEEVVSSIVQIASPTRKAMILGNHDAWFCLTPHARQRAARSALVRRPGYQGVRRMLEAIKHVDVGFGGRGFPEYGLAVVGGRPFSKGGSRWEDVRDFYSEVYGIHSFMESAYRIFDVALSQDPRLALVMLAHNGPTGLGAFRFSPCGVDWKQPEADFGDPDLADALDMLAGQNRSPALVLFGHMHHSLKGGGYRDLVSVDAERGTVFLNAAVVPRIKNISAGHGGCSIQVGHHFLLVTLENEGGIVREARHVWAGCPKEPDENDPRSHCILAEQVVLKAVDAADGSGRRVVSFYKGHTDSWAHVVCGGNKSPCGVHA
jgi:uncharacterized protein (TIGR04168 family)